MNNNTENFYRRLGKAVAKGSITLQTAFLKSLTVTPEKACSSIFLKSELSCKKLGLSCKKIRDLTSAGKVPVSVLVSIHFASV